MTELQNKIQFIENPKGVDKACEDLRILLSSLSWVSHPYHIAQRFNDKKEGKQLVYPEVYVKDSDSKILKYHRLTPDNDYTGMFFFFVGDGRNDTEDYTSYDVGIIFSVNMSKIDNEKLINEHLFTQELIESVKSIIRKNKFSYDFELRLLNETRDLKTVYKEFVLEDLERYNRLPMQCFRLNLTIKISELC